MLIQKGRMQRAGSDKQGERLTDIEIEKEKKKLGIRDEFIQIHGQKSYANSP